MKFASFFSGIGGFELGLSRAGHECVFACEKAPFARQVYAERFGHEPQWSDINAVKPEEIHEADLWCGGFPCQDLSTAGRRAGIDGERSGLVWKFLELAGAVRPRWLLLENVPGLLSMDRGHAFGRLLVALGELGFRWAYRVLDARHFGVPQRRRRVFILAGRIGDGPDPASILLEPEGRERNPAAREGARPCAATLAATGLRRARVEDELIPEGDYRATAFPITAREGKGPDSSSSSGNVVAYRQNFVGELLGTGEEMAPLRAKPSVGGEFICFDPAQVTHPENRSRCEPGEPAPSLHATPPPPHIAYHVHAQGSCAKERHAFESDEARCLDGTGGFASGQGGTLIANAVTASAGHHGHSSPRGDGSDNLVIAPTLTAPEPTHRLGANGKRQDGGRRDKVPIVVAFDHTKGSHGSGVSLDEAHALGAHHTRHDAISEGAAVRRLTPLECERLQGFPDRWTDIEGASDSKRYAVLGNAVAVPVIEWIGRRLQATTRQEKANP